MDISGIFRTLMFFFDKIIYSFIPTVYNFIMQLAGVSVFDEEKLDTISKNLYALIGLFVIFRVAIVLLNAIVNPDKLDDKKEGATKIITRFIIALVLIVVIPIGFDVAYDVQKTILKNQVINKVLIGEQDVSEGNTSAYGYQMAKTSLSAFLTCSETLTKIAETETGATEEDTPGQARTLCNQLDEGLTVAFMPANGLRSFKLLDERLNTKDEITPPGSAPFPYAYTYNTLISTIAGAIILLMLITLCFDVAVRIVKLAFFEIMAPIAVIGYVDPKGDVFSRWLKAVGKTYLNLFIRIAAISFVTLTLSMIDMEGGMKGLTGESLTGSTLTFAKIFIIIGLLIFAKELPNLLSEIFNIKDSGNILNPFKKLGSMAVVGGAAAGLATGAIGGAAALGMKGVAGLGGAVSGGIAAKRKGGSIFAGVAQGGLQASKNVKFGDAYKGGLKGIGKTTMSGFGGWGKGRDYAASQVTGKEEHVGLVNAAKNKMHSTAQGIHEKAEDKELLTAEKEIKNLRASHGGEAAIKAAPGNKYNRSDYFDHEIFSNRDFAKKFQDYSNDKAAVKQAENAFNDEQIAYQSNLTSLSSALQNASSKLSEARVRQSVASASYSSALASGTLTQTIIDAKNVADTDVSTWTAEETRVSTDIVNAKKTYDTARADLKTKQGQLESSTASFEAAKKLGSNAKDVEKLNRRAELKNTRRI